jgi:hypothetical protein
MSHVPPSASPEPSDEDYRLEPPRYGERIADADRAAPAWTGEADRAYPPTPTSQVDPAAQPSLSSAGIPSAGVAPAAVAGAVGAPLSPPPTESVVRGLMLALLVIPVGATAWVLLWNFGFVASIVSFGIAWGAVRLYRVGSGGAVTRGAFWGIIVIIVVALAVSMLAAIANDLISATGLGMTAALTSDGFWTLYWHNIFGNGRMWAAYLPSILMMILFGALGCFNTIRRLARESRRVSG